MTQRRSVHAPQSNGNTRFAIGVLVLGVFVAVGAYMLAKSDDGAIDVSATITNANIERRAETGGESTGAEAVPEFFQNMPNGGLVPQGGSTAPAPEPAPAPAPTPTEETATTTEGSVEAEEGSTEAGAPTENPDTTSAETSEEVPQQ
jgi:hypothetical protein